MRIYYFFALLLGLAFYGQSHAAVSPSTETPIQQQWKKAVMSKLLSIKATELETLRGKKLSFTEKVKLKILKLTVKLNGGEEQLTEKQRKQGRWSMILGLSSIALLAIPYLGILAFPAAIAGLILGLKSIKGNSNTNGIIGVIASSLTLLIAIIAIIVVAAFFATWGG